MQLAIGIALFILGFLLIRACVRDYLHDTSNAIADDLWDYLCGRTLAIVSGIAMLAIGGLLILLALDSTRTISLSGKFPYVELHRHPPVPARHQ